MNLKVEVLGSDSFGVRSLSLSIDTGSVKILVDPGVSYAPRRYGLPPHRKELERYCEVRKAIVEEMREADIVIITHYHYDHYLYRSEDAQLYRGKTLLIKNPYSSINYSQKLRANRFLRLNRVSELADQVIILDNKKVKIDKEVAIMGSRPFPHGSPKTKLGYVIMVTIECCGERLLYASDVQGPICNRAKDYITGVKPDLIVLSGPPLYLSGFKIEEKDVERGVSNLYEIIRILNNTIFIVDHHSARSLDYLDFIRKMRKANPLVYSGAEYRGRKVELLEALRKKLWEEDPEQSKEAIDCY